MRTLIKIVALGIACLALVGPVLAAGSAESPEAKPQAAAAAAKPGPAGFSIFLGTAFPAGLVILGGAYAIGRIGSAAVESMARQPEVATSINMAMIISAALIEGVTFFALIICLLALYV